jgi:glucosamine--fructose-6-phosphate aminotransferase (isomerizing)
MCGIFGIVGEKSQTLGKKLVAGGKRLSYRGYDSVGCAVFNGNKIVLRKDVGTIEAVSRKLQFSALHGTHGIIQLRWATFGAPSKRNAQPFYGCGSTIAGASNGNITNSVTLRQWLKKRGHELKSTNDGEVCVHLVEHFYRKHGSMVKALCEAYKLMRGDYTIMLINVAEVKIYAIKKGSGLMVGLGKNEAYCSSDLPSILQFTRRMVQVNDGEIVAVSPGQAQIYDAENGNIVQRRSYIYKGNAEFATKAGYRHFMEKEIHEQTEASRALIHLLEDSPFVAPFTKKLARSRQIYLVGCGSSYHACVLGSYYFNYLADRTAIPVTPNQLIEQYSSALNKRNALVFVSQSGETKDVINAAKAAKESGAKVLGVINVIGSTLMRMSDIYLPLAAGYEVSVPATKTFVNQALLFAIIAKELGGKKDKNALENVPTLLASTLKKTRKNAKQIARYLKRWPEFYVLGYGSTLGTALEAALKMKEITYQHAEGMLSSEFKHGPLSSVERGYPVIFIASKGNAEMLINHVNEVECRGGKSIVIGQHDKELKKNSSVYVTLPEAGECENSIMATIPAQLIAYELSLLHGIDPDKPRNLSKTITVD